MSQCCGGRDELDADGCALIVGAGVRPFLPLPSFLSARPTGSGSTPIGSGGCILHHSLTVHWSPANNSPRWRRAFVCHFVRSDATLGARHPNSSALPTVLP